MPDWFQDVIAAPPAIVERIGDDVTTNQHRIVKRPAPIEFIDSLAPLYGLGAPTSLRDDLSGVEPTSVRARILACGVSAEASGPAFAFSQFACSCAVTHPVANTDSASSAGRSFFKTMCDQGRAQLIGKQKMPQCV